MIKIQILTGNLSKLNGQFLVSDIYSNDK